MRHTASVGEGVVVKNLRIGMSSRSVLLEVCRTSGRLENVGLAVVDAPVSSSSGQFRALAELEFDGVIADPHDVIANRLIGADSFAGQHDDVVITAALDRGLGLTFAVRPGLHGPAALRSGTIAVDAPDSGAALLAYELLAARGIVPGDYRVVALGSPSRRAAALIAGKCDGTVLNDGNELLAEQNGCTLHSSVADVGPYLGSVLARLRSADSAVWVDRLGDVLAATACDISEGDLQSEVLEASQRVLGLSEHQAHRHRARLMDSREGLIPDGFVDTPSIETLLGLRAKYLRQPQTVSTPASLDSMLVGVAAHGRG